MGEARLQRPASLYPTYVQIAPEQEIRVLDLQPGHGEDDIRCQLSVQRLVSDSATDYVALSYVWGDWVNHGFICLNGVRNFPVTHNLLMALRRLRKTDKACRLWIDQICINQQDASEKTRQVKHIGRIFGQARNVILWFGDASGDAEGEIHAALMETISSNFVAQWWTRAWVIQEYALARNDPTVMFGPYQMRWDEVQDLAIRKSQFPWDKWALFGIDIGRYNFLRSSELDRNLHYLSIVLTDAVASNARDKVYSIFPSLPDKERNLITLDYNKSVSEVFAQATYASIASTGSLGIMSLVSRSVCTGTYDLPTWAVDFTFPDKNQAIRVLQFPDDGLRVKFFNTTFKPFQTLKPTGMYFLFNFESSQRSWCKRYPRQTAEVSFDPNDYKRLALTGLAFNQVQHVVRVNVSTKDGNLGPGSMLENMINAISPTSTSRWTSWLDSKAFNSMEQEIYSSIQLLLSNGNPYRLISSSKGSNVQLDLSTAQKEWTIRLTMVGALFRQWDKSARPQNARPILEPSLSTILEIFREIDKSNSLEFLRASIFKAYLLFHPRGVTFFITAAGFIGLGPMDLEQDDVIALLYGGQFPVALRRTATGSWNFVGFLYVRGIMDGELLEYFPDIEMRETKFVLE
ncbi:heterokaryon incompatibility protein-domain-containing protein [Aspergillus ambiguus]|uniref:heterokaryon incompatibility protein-domain-containing protein n=1 Tax=Aspergillus ambiguus TaxID=176160 RepID=UPI003CCDE8B6